RLWVAAWRNYPERTPTSKKGDSLLIFEDTDGDGKADKCSTFIDDLNAPTGFQFYKDGVLVMQAPSLWFVRDTDGDGKADWKERILMGMDSADSHHTANAICYEPGGAIFLNINVISFQGIYRVKNTEDGSGIKGETMENLVSSTDPNFRPICINMGPEGAIYFCDWHNPIIGHMQHHLRDPNRDKVHGRIYRICHEGRPYMKRIKFDGMSVDQLLDLLKEPENQTRELAKSELDKHDPKEVLAALKKWT